MISSSKKSKGPDHCPIYDLKDRELESFDTSTLCGFFRCKVCVATPEDFGYPPNTESSESDISSWEIDF